MAAFPGPGKLGEYKESVRASASALSLSTGTAKSITTLSLQPGAWDVQGVIDFQFAATTSYTCLQAGISTTADTLGAQDTYSTDATAANVHTAAFDIGLNTPTIRINATAATTMQLVAQGTFTVDTLKAYGTLRARRVRD